MVQGTLVADYRFAPGRNRRPRGAYPEWRVARGAYSARSSRRAENERLALLEFEFRHVRARFANEGVLHHVGFSWKRLDHRDLHDAATGRAFRRRVGLPERHLRYSSQRC